jgi:hypothetical protein
MKRRVAIVICFFTLLFCSSAYAGHHLGTGYVDCPGSCTTAGVCSVCGASCDPGIFITAQPETDSDSGFTIPTPSKGDDDLGTAALFLTLLLLAIRLRVA